jgi:hypothetical protein
MQQAPGRQLLLRQCLHRDDRVFIPEANRIRKQPRTTFSETKADCQPRNQRVELLSVGAADGYSLTGSTLVASGQNSERNLTKISGALEEDKSSSEKPSFLDASRNTYEF